MIGAANTQSAGVNITPQYSVYLAPSYLYVFSFNGSTTSPLVRSTVNGGSGNYTYQWSVDNNKITINTPTSADTTFRASGFNGIIEGVGTLTVTDTGNGDAQTLVNIDIQFEFER